MIEAKRKRIRTGTRKKKLSGLDKYVIYCIVFFTCYVAAELIVSSITGTINDTLTNAVKWFCGGEAFLCAMIKRHKLKNEHELAKEIHDQTQEERAELEQGGYYDD